MKKNPLERIIEYQELYSEFVKIDDFNLEERTRKVPAEKHFWVSRLIDAKIERERLQKQRKNFNSTMSEKIRQTSPVALNESEITKQVNSSPSLEALNDELRGYEFLIEYLERLVSCVNFIAQDVKNIIECKKLEEQ